MIYLIHFQVPISGISHFLGMINGGEKELLEKFNDHKRGFGQNIFVVTRENNISISITRIWPDGDEKYLKKLQDRKRNSTFCPICNPWTWETNACEIKSKLVNIN